MIVQLVTLLVHLVTNTSAVHTAPGPVAPTVTVVATTVSHTIDKGFDVLTLEAW